MKDEEMAEDYRKSLKQRLIDNDEFERLEKFDENVEEAFLAGLKAGRPQWHDLRKDPNDLPKKNTKVCLYAKDKECYMGFWENGAWKYEGGFYTTDDFVIAWCEKPQFEE